MQHLKKLLIRLQTFELKALLPHEITPFYDVKSKVPFYDIYHETKQTGNSTFEYELRKLLDMAIVDLIMLDAKRVKLIHEETNKIGKRIIQFWAYYYHYYQGWNRSASEKRNIMYQMDYIYDIGLHQLFFVKNLLPRDSEVFVGGKFVEELRDSMKLRISILTELIKHTSLLLLPGEDKPSGLVNSPFKPTKKIVTSPIFITGSSEKFLELIKSYFSPNDQKHLLPLIKNNELPISPLVFHGNGNQLVDAFKQLYEANLIVGCNKGELEEWIGANFEYVYRNRQKAFPANYLNAMISSNSKPCQSPILDVKKQPDGTYNIIPVLRTKKNYSVGK